MMPVGGEGTRVLIETIDSAAICANPERAAGILDDGPNLVAADTAGVGRIMREPLKAHAVYVEPIQPVVGAEPQGACLILEHDPNSVTTQTGWSALS